MPLYTFSFDTFSSAFTRRQRDMEFLTTQATFFVRSSSAPHNHGHLISHPQVLRQQLPHPPDYLNRPLPDHLLARYLDLFQPDLGLYGQQISWDLLRLSL